MKKYFTIDQKKQVITIDTTVKPQAGDKETIKLFVEMGYKMRIKSQRRAAIARERATGLTADEIRNELSSKTAKKKFDDIIAGRAQNAEGKTGFFAAKKWYLTEYKQQKKAENKEQDLLTMSALGGIS